MRFLWLFLQKSTARNLSSLSERLSVFGYSEVKSAACLAVYAIFLEEIKAAFARFKPLVFNSVNMAQISKNPSATALHPHALVCRKNLAVFIKTGVDSAVNLIHSVIEPKICYRRELILYPFSFF